MSKEKLAGEIEKVLEELLHTSRLGYYKSDADKAIAHALTRILELVEKEKDERKI